MPKPSDLYIVGAGGFGREVLTWLHEIPLKNREWEVKGFLNSIPSALDGYDVDFSILCDPLDFKFTGKELVICAIGDPSGKLKLCRTLIQNGANFFTFINSYAMVSARAILGDGCIIATATIIGPDAKIGSFTTILGLTAIGPDSVIGEGTTISAFSSVGEGSVIGKGVFLGSHAIVMPGTKVGDYARIGARTVVSGDIPAGATFFGIPGQMIAR